jgi:hypothetical protein
MWRSTFVPNGPFFSELNSNPENYYNIWELSGNASHEEALRFDGPAAWFRDHAASRSVRYGRYRDLGFHDLQREQVRSSTDRPAAASRLRWQQLHEVSAPSIEGRLRRQRLCHCRTITVDPTPMKWSKSTTGSFGMRARFGRCVPTPKL